jgi:hypothetical protein
MVNVVIAVRNVRESGNDYWIVIRCSVREEAVPPNIRGFEIIIPLRSGKQYKSKKAAVKEMQERIWKILMEKGHRENDEQVKWDITEEV